MISKPHRNNSDFQLKHFLANSCHTPDGAWMLLYGQLNDMDVKLKLTKSQALKTQAGIMRAEKILSSKKSTKADKLEAEADIIEIQAGEETWRLNTEAAQAEYNTIKSLMDELEPLRKYSHLPLLEANEAAQEEEWLGELKCRAENFLLTQGSIPHDHFETMRNHPSFKQEIVPHIENLSKMIAIAKSSGEVMLQLEAPKWNNLLIDKSKASIKTKI
jgi:hypothetical protein